MVVIDAVTRLLPGALGKDESSHEESFSANCLEYPHYTRPAVFRGMKVPDVLLSTMLVSLSGVASNLVKDGCSAAGFVEKSGSRSFRLMLDWYKFMNQALLDKIESATPGRTPWPFR